MPSLGSNRGGMRIRSQTNEGTLEETCGLREIVVAF